VSGSRLGSRFGLSVRRQAHVAMPSVHIYLQRLVRHSNGMLSVTPVCSTLAEMEGQIGQLKDELDDMLRQARRAFREGDALAGGG
jgi:hypothetical protein